VAGRIQRRARLGFDQIVTLMVIGAALAMTHDDIAAAQILEH
jgi:hypothetical protein